MKKLKKFIRFLLIFLVTSAFLAFIGHKILKFFWNFDIFSVNSYIRIAEFWENGGVFNSFKDISLILCLLLLPVLMIVFSKKLYKNGFWKTILSPLVKIYNRMTRPKNLEVEHVVIKNLGAKNRSLDELISDKIKEKEGNQPNISNTTKDIRNQISLKIKENETQ